MLLDGAASGLGRVGVQTKGTRGVRPRAPPGNERGEWISARDVGVCVQDELGACEQYNTGWEEGSKGWGVCIVSRGLLRLILQARAKLPKHLQAVWRGVKGVNLTNDFPKGKKLFWWAFNSTSRNVSTLHNPMFCGTSGTRTQFMVEASSGVDIERFSMVGSEAEVLLFPGTKLEVVDVATMAPGLFQVHLREVTVPIQLFK